MAEVLLIICLPFRCSSMKGFQFPHSGSFPYLMGCNEKWSHVVCYLDLFDSRRGFILTLLADCMTRMLSFSNNKPCFTSSCYIGGFHGNCFLWPGFLRICLHCSFILCFYMCSFLILLSGIFSGLSLTSCSLNFSDPFLLTLVMFKRQVVNFFILLLLGGLENDDWVSLNLCIKYVYPKCGIYISELLSYPAMNAVRTRSHSAVHDGLDMVYWRLWLQVGDCYSYLNAQAGWSYIKTKMESQDYEPIHAATQQPSGFDICWGYMQL